MTTSTAVAIEMKRRVCLMVAPHAADLSTVRRLLQDRGIEPRALSTMPPVGATVLDQVRTALAQADVVVFVLTTPHISPNMYVEMGLALGLNKRLLIFAPAGITDTPSDLRGLLVVTAPLDDEEAIGFSLDQLLAAPPRSVVALKAPASVASGRPLAHAADVLIERAERLKESVGRRSTEGNVHEEFEQIVTAALEESNVAPIVASRTQGQPDLAVWVDELDSLGLNPLIIELKLRLDAPAAIAETTTQARGYIRDFRAQAILIVYVIGPRSDDVPMPLPGAVVSISLIALLKEMRTQSFGIVLRDALNKGADTDAG